MKTSIHRPRGVAIGFAVMALFALAGLYALLLLSLALVGAL